MEKLADQLERLQLEREGATVPEPAPQEAQLQLDRLQLERLQLERLQLDLLQLERE